MSMPVLEYLFTKYPCEMLLEYALQMSTVLQSVVCSLLLVVLQERPGAVGCISLVIESESIQDDLLVLGGFVASS